MRAIRMIEAVASGLIIGAGIGGPILLWLVWRL